MTAISELSINKFINDFTIESGSQPIPDVLRNSLQLYWSNSNYQNTLNNVARDITSEYKNIRFDPPYKFINPGQGLIYSTQLKIEPNTQSERWQDPNSGDYNPVAWQNYILNDVFQPLTDADFLYDHSLKVQTLVDRDGGTYDEGSVVKPPLVNYDFEYNFFINGYETTINPSYVPETVLPNLYVFGSEINEENLDGQAGMPSTIYSDHITLDGRIENVFVDIVTDKTNEKIGESDSGEYFNKYVRALSDSIENNSIPQDLQDLGERYKNVIFPQAGIDLMKNYNSRKNLFPMYTEIDFDTTTSTQIAQVLTECGLGGELIKWVINNNSSVENMVATDVNEIQNQIQTETKFENYDSWDVSEWIQSLFSQDPPATDNTNMIFMGGTSKDNSTSNNPASTLYKSLMSTLLYSKIIQIAKNNFRDMNDVYNGKTSYSETVFYEVKKYEGDSEIEENYLQSFYFINSNDIDVMNFVDTQVKYNKQYTYVIHAYQIVLGNKYIFYPLTSAISPSGVAVIDANTEPSWKLYKIPLSTKTNRVVDRPPVFPDVDIVPYRSINNKLLLQIKSNVGIYELDPIAIEASDDDKIAEIREAQNKPQGPIEYKTDDKTTAFQIFRMEHEPSSYSDFDTHLIATVDTTFRNDTNYFLPSAAFVDDITPNQQYYYTLRSLDNHGHFSNPSPIYKVKLVDNSGAIYPEIEVITLKPRGYNTKVPTKGMRKYIQLIPSLPQTLLNEDELFPEGTKSRNSPQITNGYNQLPLGVLENSIWDQKYKVRIVSKKTGRKFDINVKFRNRGDSSEKQNSE